MESLRHTEALNHLNQEQASQGAGILREVKFVTDVLTGK